MLLLMFRRHAFALILTVALSPSAALAQSDSPRPPRTSISAKAEPATPVTTETALQQPPQIVVTAPPAQALPWSWHDKVLWGVEIVLVILGYAGVLLALKTLKIIQRQAEFGVSAAQAALQCANAALESSSSTRCRCRRVISGTTPTSTLATRRLPPVVEGCCAQQSLPLVDSVRSESARRRW